MSMHPLAAVELTLRLLTLALAVWWTFRLRDRLMALLAMLATMTSVWVLANVGGDHPLSLHLTSLVASIGVFFVVVISAQVLSKRLEARRALERSEEESRLTLSETADAVFVTDHVGRFIRVWPNVRAVFGLSPEQFLGLGSVAGLFGSDFPSPDASDPAAGLENLERSYATPSGEDRTVLVEARPIPIEGGGLLFTCRDVTRRKTDREALDEALAEVTVLRDRLAQENRYLHEEIRLRHNFGEIIGGSTAIRSALQRVERVASTDATVLITGETGVGKELFARAVHELSPRSRLRLVKVDCAALPPTLVESELFGHERGAFTGATGRKIGRFELADGGTLFLDEVGELPLELQPKLLRFLQEGEFERVGGARTLKVDVRVVAATNRSLEREVEEGRFRSDLLYRLNVFPISVPPLRDRKEDLPLLVDFFLERNAVRLGKPLDGVSPRSMARLRAHHWPGNVRELRNIIEKSAIDARSSTVEVRLAPVDGSGSDPAATGAVRRWEDLQRTHITGVLEAHGWRIEGKGGAAATLGLNPSTLRSRIKKLGIERA